ncbi:MAG: DUF1611 domain-containing protein [Sphingomonas sp.]
MSTEIPRPYLIFLGEAVDALDAKTGAGLAEWRPNWCAGQYRFAGGQCDLGLPDMTPSEASAMGIKTMVIGGATFGGRLTPEWIVAIEEAIDAGLNVASGLHDRMRDNPALVAHARDKNVLLFDVRGLPPGHRPSVATGRKRSGRRLLTVGTDCAVGKKFTALAVERAMLAKGWAATFRATGQTGVLISGGGVAIDAVVADFLAGVVEDLSPDAAPDHWDIVEGQGALHHPAYAAVSLGLLHGSQPDAFIVCHDGSRQHVEGYPDFALPSVEAVIQLTIANGCRLNPGIRCVGAAINGSKMDRDDFEALKHEIGLRIGLPVFDPAVDDLSGLLAEIDRR